MTMLPIDEADVLRPYDSTIRSRLWSAAPPAAVVPKAPGPSSRAPVPKPSAPPITLPPQASATWISFQMRQACALAAKLCNPDFDVVSSSPREILREVAGETGIGVGDLLGPRRTRPVVRARHEAIWRMATRRPDMSLPEIGRRMGGKDHTTVLHALRTYAKRNGLHYPERAPGAGGIADR